MKVRKLVYGVGINDANYQISTYVMVEGKRKRTWICPFYTTWASMLRRCYDQKELKRQPNYKGCSVCNEWKYFSNFKAWMETQDWEGKQLDKDLLFNDNKIYSPDTCCFVEKVVNTFIIERDALRGEYPIGVFFSKSRNKLQSSCRNPFTNKADHLGYFDCPQEAHQAWLTHKLKLAKMLAAEQDDPRVAEALIRRYENYNQE